MGVHTRTFNRKSFPVEAVQVTNTNFEDVRAWCDGEEVPKSGKTPRHFKVPVIRPMSHTQTKARVGDWVLYANNGFKVYPDAAFRKYFEPVTQNTAKVYKKPDVFPGEPVDMQEQILVGYPKPGPHAGRSYWPADSE